MSLKLDMTIRCQKFLKDLPAKQFRQIVTKIFELMKDPKPSDASPLQGFPYYRADSGEFRIIYRFDPETLWLVLIGKRNDDEVYKQLRKF